MANEAVKVEACGNSAFIRSFTVANANAITKGTIMALVGDNTASASTTTSSGAQFAGIALADKEANDGCTVLALDTGGVWDLTASSAIGAGEKVTIAFTNMVQPYNLTNVSSGAYVVGTAMEAASASEVIRVDLTKR